MSRLILFLVVAASWGTASAQQPSASSAAGGVKVDFKDGKSVVSSQLRRSGRNLVATVAVGTGTGEIGYPVSTVERVEFPEPAQLTTATSLLSESKAAEALAQLDPIVTYFEPFKDIEGNWWSQAAVLKLTALVALGRDNEATPLIEQLSKAATDPEAVRMAKVQQAARLTRKGDYATAGPIYDAVIKEATNRDTLARAWLNKGHNLYALRDWEPALLAYLHVPVYYSGNKVAMPPALLGSGRALMQMDARDEAQKRFADLIETYPASPEAAEAKAEIEKLQKRQS